MRDVLKGEGKENCLGAAKVGGEGEVLRWRERSWKEAAYISGPVG